MENFKELSLEEAKTIKGGKYYGNGLHVPKHGKPYVNWGQAIQSIGRISYHGWMNGIVKL